METDWNAILAQGETMHVDFKAAMAWEGNARADLAEDIVAMANVRDGGMLLIGVAEGDGGRPDIQGLSDEQLATFDATKVCDYVASYFEPTVHLRVEKPSLDGKTIVAIRVSEFETTPIICVKDGPEKRAEGGKVKRAFYAGNLIVRTPAAKSETIRSAEDMHALVRLAVGKTSDALLTDMRRIIEGRVDPRSEAPLDLHSQELAMWTDALRAWRTRQGFVGTFNVVLLPTRALREQLPDHKTLRSVLTETHVRALGFEFPRCFEDNFTKVQNRQGAIQGTVTRDRHQEIWQFHDSGAFMYAAVVREDLDPRFRSVSSVAEKERFLDSVLLTYRVGLSVMFAQRLYERLDRDGNIVFQLAFDETRDRRLLSVDPWRDLDSDYYRAVDPSVGTTRTISVLDLRSGWQEFAASVVKQIFSLFNLDVSARTISPDLDKLAGRG